MRKFISVLFALVLVLSLAIVAAPATPVKAQATTINVPADNATITIAIATASPGDIINVTANLSANVVVNKNNLTIQGAWGSANTTITAKNENQPVFVVSANNTTIKDFTITGATGAPGVRLNGVSGKVDSANITGNLYGVWVTGTQNRIIRNTISGNTAHGVHLPGTREWNEVTYNDITNNTGYGVYAEPVSGEPYWMQGASFNWWGHISGPSGTSPWGDYPGSGDEVNRYVWVNPWLNSGYSGILTSGIADISMAIPLQVGWNTLSTPLALAADSNNWNEIVSNSSLSYAQAFAYSPSAGWGELSTSNTTVLRPLDAVFIKMLSDSIIILKVSMATNPPPTKDLEAGWNLIGASMAITDRELEMWKVLKSVDLTADGKIGYDMVVSPPLATQGPWVYVRGQEGITEATREAFEWEKMDFGRGYWIYMENADEMAGFASTPITARIWD